MRIVLSIPHVHNDVSSVCHFILSCVKYRAMLLFHLIITSCARPFDNLIQSQTSTYSLCGKVKSTLQPKLTPNMYDAIACCPRRKNNRLKLQRVENIPKSYYDRKTLIIFQVECGVFQCIEEDPNAIKMSGPIIITVPNSYLMDMDEDSVVDVSPSPSRKRRLDHLSWEEKMQRK